MQLSRGIAVTLGFITCLSSFMLGLGQNDYMLPILMTAAAVSSFYFTDCRRIIRFGDWTVNVLVLFIVFCTLGEILHNKGEDLAFSIARVLVFVEMVLLFRSKEINFCWQILLISLLQVLVASALQQSIFFGLLLLLYIFTGLCAFVLLFLQQEHSYYRRHSFTGTLLDSIKSEIAERIDRSRLARIALMTLLTGPLSLVFSFSDSAKKEKQDGNVKDTAEDNKLTAKEILRSLFAVFPAEHVNIRNRWETVDGELAAENNSLTASAVRIENLVPVPSGVFRPVRANSAEEQQFRFPLLTERPSFSGGTMTVSGWDGGLRELLRYLLRGTFFALFFAVLLFCLIPRVGKIEFGGHPLKFGYDNWLGSFVRPVNSVGFRDEVRLGSLGTVLPYHREVMSVKFVKYLDKQIPQSRDDTAQEVPYNEISGAALYFRGVPLDAYTGGTWKNATAAAGRSERSKYKPILFFEDGTDLVGLKLTVQPLDTKVFFAPNPFVNRPYRNNFLVFADGYVEEVRPRRRELRATVFTAAFRHGVQLPAVPCQEDIDPATLLQIPEQGLDALKALARQWDKESGRAETDIVGRASFMEQKFLHSERFRYQLGGVQRTYGIDPLEDFVAKNSAGHCEYFAGALALMLRSVGIGSRVIVGYKTAAAHSSDDETLVRQSDAHTWVDVYLPPEYVLNIPGRQRYREEWTDGGWLRLDPTPAEETSLLKTVSFGITDLKEWIQSLWDNFVLNMNSPRQTEWIYAPLQTVWYYIVDFFRNDIFQPDFYLNTFSKVWHYYRNLFKSSYSHWQLGDWGRLALPAVILVPLLYLCLKILLQLRIVFGWNGSGERQRDKNVEFYYRLEQLLEKSGVKRRKAETPAELINRSEYESLTYPVVDAFYRIRFGAEELDGDERRRIQSVIEQLERVLAAS
ncbi:MAG: DUF3488 and transglutaminase-like domain-containing protein [Planctomycetaceae bacterium]|jgi:transglutaminase-like putative cysteine protease|nr:DUF3488 and transglutaminase-like domain-containing protein [Planctomycetaceae bacterium]